MTLTQGYTSKVKVAVHTYQNPCLVHNSSLPSLIWIIFHTTVVHDSRVCHDLDPKSYLWGQGHSAHIPKICVRAITLPCHVGSEYFTQLLSMTLGYVMTFIQGHTGISEVKVTQHTYLKSVSGSCLFTVKFEGDDFSLNCCPCHRGCCRGYLSR